MPELSLQSNLLYSKSISFKACHQKDTVLDIYKKFFFSKRTLWMFLVLFSYLLFQASWVHVSSEILNKSGKKTILQQSLYFRCFFFLFLILPFPERETQKRESGSVMTPKDWAEGKQKGRLDGLAYKNAKFYGIGD